MMRLSVTLKVVSLGIDKLVRSSPEYFIRLFSLTIDFSTIITIYNGRIYIK